VTAVDRVEGSAEDAEDGLHRRVDCSLQRLPEGP
jgi:hypothetical protein